MDYDKAIEDFKQRINNFEKIREEIDLTLKECYKGLGEMKAMRMVLNDIEKEGERAK